MIRTIVALLVAGAAILQVTNAAQIQQDVPTTDGMVVDEATGVRYDPKYVKLAARQDGGNWTHERKSIINGAKKVINWSRDRKLHQYKVKTHRDVIITQIQRQMRW